LNHADAGLAEDFFRMGRKRQNKRMKVIRPGSLNKKAEDLLMSEVNAVEVSDGYGRWPTPGRQLVKSFEHAHCSAT
jgi:hypothetical protein